VTADTRWLFADLPGPATLAGVKNFLRITGTADDALIQATVDAVNMFVSRLPARTYAPTVTPPIAGEWPPDTELGATMLAGRWFRRRLSPAGVESFSDLGGAVYVQRNDPDVAILLGIGAYARPMIG
jgi:hypothetical protein